MVAKMEKSFLPCAHSASSLFILAMGHSQRGCLIQAGVQGINGGIANCQEYKNYPYKRVVKRERYIFLTMRAHCLVTF